MFLSVSYYNKIISYGLPDLVVWTTQIRYLYTPLNLHNTYVNIRFNNVSTQLHFSFIPENMIAGDDVVAYKFGEKSAEKLTSTGFRDVTFKSYPTWAIFCYMT